MILNCGRNCSAIISSFKEPSNRNYIIISGAARGTSQKLPTNSAKRGSLIISSIPMPFFSIPAGFLVVLTTFPFILAILFSGRYISISTIVPGKKPCLVRIKTPSSDRLLNKPLNFKSPAEKLTSSRRTYLLDFLFSRLKMLLPDYQFIPALSG